MIEAQGLPPVASVHEALAWARQTLDVAGCESPRLDAEILLCHALACSRTQLHVRWHERLSAAQAETVGELIARRAQHEPVAYIIGERAFYDVDLLVSPAVLIPRPETEHTVELALAWAEAWQAAHGDQRLRLVDVGTGSGALAVTLARQLPMAQVWAVDVSDEALAVARRNVGKYDLQERVCLSHSDLLTELAGPFELVVANLPYVCHDEIATLEADVAAYEPHLALDGGADGLDLVRRIAPQLANKLATPGLALLEIDPRQAQDVAVLMRLHLPEADVSIHKDLAGWERVVAVGRRVVAGEGPR